MVLLGLRVLEERKGRVDRLVRGVHREHKVFRVPLVPKAPAAAPVIVATTASWVCPAKLELKGQEALWEHPEQTVALDEPVTLAVEVHRVRLACKVLLVQTA